MKQLEIVKKGLLTENPLFVLLLGMCPSLGVTSSVESALGMGAGVIFVLLFSNSIVSCLRRFIHSEIRSPVYIGIIATAVTLLEMVLNAYFQELAATLGIFIPLIVVNCVILGRAESFASKNNIVDSICDALGMGLGFTGGLFLLATIREVLGSGTFLGVQVLPSMYTIPVLSYPAGAFLALAFLIALIACLKQRTTKKEVKS